MIEKIKTWCYKILPLTFDDSLSYYEVLAKVQAKLNEVIDAYNDSVFSWGNITGDIEDQEDLIELLDEKQDTLISGTTIKTINGTSVLGEGNIVISGGGQTLVAGDNIQINGNVISATDTKYTASTGITISQANAISNSHTLVYSPVNETMSCNFLTGLVSDDELDKISDGTHSLSLKDSTARASITSLGNRMTSAEGSITSLGNRVTSLETGAGSLGNRVTAVENTQSSQASDIASLKATRTNTLRYVVSQTTDTSISGISWKIVTWSDGTKEAYGLTSQYSKTLSQLGEMFETDEIELPSFPTNTFTEEIYDADVKAVDCNAFLWLAFDRITTSLATLGTVDLMRPTRLSAQTPYTFKLHIYAIGK